MVHTYHKSPQLIKNILAKYEINTPAEQIIHPTLNLPPFTIPEGFDAKRDTVTFNWEEKETIFSKVQELLSTKEWQ